MPNNLGELWKKGTVTPLPADLDQGGLAIDLVAKKAYSKAEDDTIFEIGDSSDKVAKAGDTMTGNLLFDNTRRIQGKEVDGTVRDMFLMTDSDEVSIGADANPLRVKANAITFPVIPIVETAQGAAVNELTRKDYVDGIGDTKVDNSDGVHGVVKAVTSLTTEEFSGITPDPEVMYVVPGEDEQLAINDLFYENAQNVSEDYTVLGTRNAMTAGPITIDDTITVTVEDGATWTVV